MPEFSIPTEGIKDNPTIDAFNRVADTFSNLIQEGPAASKPARAEFGSHYFETDGAHLIWWYVGMGLGPGGLGWLQIHSETPAGPTILHNTLTDLQGGLAAERYHLTLADYNALTDAHAQLVNLQTDKSPTFAGLSIVASNSVIQTSGAGWSKILLNSLNANAGARNWQITNQWSGYGSFEIMLSASAGAAPSIYAIRITNTPQIEIGDGSSGAPMIAFINEATLGIWRSGAGAIVVNHLKIVDSGTVVTLSRV